MACNNNVKSTVQDRPVSNMFSVEYDLVPALSYTATPVHISYTSKVGF